MWGTKTDLDRILGRYVGLGFEVKIRRDSGWLRVECHTSDQTLRFLFGPNGDIHGDIEKTLENAPKNEPTAVEIIDARFRAVEAENAQFDERVAESIKRLSESGQITSSSGNAIKVKNTQEPSDWVSSIAGNSWLANQAVAGGYPSKEEIRSVLHTLCAYAHDNLSSFRVVAEGVDGVGNGVLQFGIDAYPEDLKGSTFEQLVERLAAYSPNKDELSKDKQDAKADFFGDRVEFVSVGGSSTADLTNEEWVKVLDDNYALEGMPKLEPVEEPPHTLPPHILSLVRECDDCRRKIAEAEKVVVELREGGVRGETIHPVCTVEELYIDPNRELIRKNVKTLVEHFGGES